MKDNGKLLLKITSAVFMIFGVIAAIVSLIDLLTKTGDTGWLISVILLLIASVAEIIIGFMGLKKSDDHSHANFFMTTGFALAILELLSMILFFTVWGLIGLILSVLYIAGGYMLRSFVVKHV